MNSIRQNIADLKSAVAASCLRVGRKPEAVTVVAATKTVPLDRIQEALAAGIAAVGENRVQEVLAKFPSLSGVEKHFIGHLQTNKVRDAVRTCDLIESVDSVKLLSAIAAEASKQNKHISVLLEVSFYRHLPAVQRSGFEPQELRSVLEFARSLPSITVQGLMTIPLPNLSDDEIRHVFRSLRILRDAESTQLGISLPDLSMGMSEDYPIAVEEGATIIRIGRGIFGERLTH